MECDRTKPEQTQPNSQFDHELFLDGITLACAYFESGVHDFGDYAATMINDLGANGVFQGSCHHQAKLSGL